MIRNYLLGVALFCTAGLIAIGGCGGSGSGSKSTSLGNMTLMIRSKSGTVVFSETRPRFSTQTANGQWASDELMANFSYISPTRIYTYSAMRLNEFGTFPVCGTSIAIENGSLKSCAEPLEVRSAEVATLAYADNAPGDIAFIVQEK